MHHRILPALLISLLLPLAAPLRAQNVVLDEGTFRLSRGGQEIGTESFTIRRVGAGDDAHVIANAVQEVDLPAGHQQVKPLLQAGADLSLTAYQLEVSGTEQLDIAVQSNGRRFTTHIRTPTGEQDREFRATPGSVLLEDGVAHQYWFLSKLGDGIQVSVLVPRAGTQHRASLKTTSTESVQTVGPAVQARHVTFDVDGVAHEVWYDADGRVLKVSIPSTGFAAERTSR